MADFEIPGGQPPEDEQEEQYQDPEPTPEPEPEPAPQEEDRISAMERSLSDITEFLRSQQTTKAPLSEAPAVPKPDFQGNPVAEAIWNRIESINEKIDRKERQEREQARQSQEVEAEFTKLTDLVTTHVNTRVQGGEPQVPNEAVLQMLVNNGALQNRRVPYTTAIQNAYNALAYEAARKQAKTQGVNEARNPQAKVPARFTPAAQRQTQSRTPTITQEGRRNESKLDKSKRESEEALRNLSRFSPDELADALGGS